ncbi:hypothetical protein LOK49_LG05G01692 [Camellia lanceoleosa]|uniref:Uncharacterized protein n=1 Tax=Camellia lanceoleosa TaxID=1840588 RepID=A0ACC0HRQ1_9ERIC|nr:hypothetical protein LOK49_LG05G01692 [Camellia lanceoleosa]
MSSLSSLPSSKVKPSASSGEGGNGVSWERAIIQSTAKKEQRNREDERKDKEWERETKNKRVESYSPPLQGAPISDQPPSHTSTHLRPVTVTHRTSRKVGTSVFNHLHQKWSMYVEGH